METKKLSEALAELQAAASVSGLDVRLVVAGQSSTDNAQTITLQQLLTALNVPTAQSGTQGTSNNYVYSAGTDQYPKTILSSKIWIYQNGGYDKFLRFKHWGANNDENAENYSQVWLPPAWTGGNGLLRWDVYRRLDAFELREQNSTATEVKIVTPIFTTGGTRTLSISAATTAKAGVMTAADKQLLEQIKTKLGL